ncbi:unnamed protein product [Tetraodon nigroviridis]|uniref:(spotted green pufferfish) hypothetical protein n=1 Tax=Tetraodon nigroviridis TaxID=99883 RepID=Q4RK65_TETNG|nr:unnamed protein product [Tetraodon nigroviridis]
MDNMATEANNSCNVHTRQKKERELTEEEKTFIHIHSPTTTYLLQESICGGAFGQVSRAQNTCTKEMVALKFTKNLTSAHREACMISRIHASPGVSRSNFVKLLDCFTNGSQVCLVYEMLSVGLLKALELRKLKPWSLAQIRPVAKQVQG